MKAKIGYTILALFWSFLLFGQKRPEAIATTGDDSMKSLENKEEIASLRTANTRHYKTDGFTTAIVSLGKLNYKKNGKWTPIENNILPNSYKIGEGYDYVNISNEFINFYSTSIHNGVKTEFNEGEVKEWLNPQLAWLDSNKQIIGSCVLPSDNKGIVNSSSIIYKNVYTNIDAKFTQQNQSRKLDYVINNPEVLQSRPTEAKYLVFLEDVKLPSGWHLQRQLEKNQNGTDDIKSICVFDNSNKAMIEYSLPFYREEMGTGNNKDAFSAGSYYLNRVNNNITIGVLVSVDWLLLPQRKYPVIVDPTANFSPSNIANWTGYVKRNDDSPNTITSYSNDFNVGWYDDWWPSTNYRWHGWMKFNIAGIPDVAQLVQTKLHFTAYSSYSQLRILYTWYGNGAQDPVTRTASQRYTDILSSTTYGVTTLTTAAPVNYTITFPGALDPSPNVESKLATDWYAMGLQCLDDGTGGSGGNDSYYYCFYGYSSGNAPYLIITYCDYHPTAAGGTDKSICNTNTVNMTGTAPLGTETGSWSIQSGCSGCTFGSASSATSSVNNIPQGTSTVRWTINVTDGGCQAYDDVIITNNTPTTATAGSDATTCVTPYTLSGNFPSIGTGAWSVITGAGIFSPGNTSYNASVSNLNVGANTYRWTITNNGCSLSDDVIITLATLPSILITTPASSPLSICSSTQSLCANTPGASNTGLWYVVSGGGTISAPTSSNTTISNLGFGDNVVRWTVTSSTGIGCVSSDNVTITNNLPTTSNAGPDQNISAATTTLAGNPPGSGCTGLWTLVSGAPVLTITSPTSYNSGITGITSGVLYTLRWTVTRATGGCPPSTDDMEIYWDPGMTGLIVENNLINSGTFIHTEDPNSFYMTGSTPNYITGTNGTYTDAKVKIKGTIQFDGTIASGMFSRSEVLSGRFYTINSSKTLKNRDFINGGTLTLSASSIIENSGDWTNNSTVTANTSSTVKYNGTANRQTIVTGGSNFGNVVFDNTYSDATWDIKTNKMTIVTNATFNNGVVAYTASTDTIIFPNGATVTPSVSATTGFVDGVVQKRGTNAFIFPTGNVQTTRKVSAPIGISAVAYSGFTAGYKYSAPANPANLDVDLDHVSEVEYWTLNRDQGGTTPTATLYWMDGSRSGISDVTTGVNQDLFVAHYEDVTAHKWQNMGGNISGTISAGSITSTVSFPNYSPITIGTKTGKNKLPVTLLDFAGTCNDNFINLKWSTSSEINNDGFVLERSFDSEIWDKIAYVNGAGNSNNTKQYEYFDKINYGGTIYYRITQVDFDGKSLTENKLAVVSCKSSSLDASLFLFPNPAKDELNLLIVNSSSDEGMISISDEMGKQIISQKIVSDNVNGKLLIDISLLKPGSYFLRCVLDKKIFPVQKVVVY